MGSDVAWTGDDAIDGMLLDALPGPTDVAAIEAVGRWLLTPLSGSPEHFVAASVAWHGRLMVLGMGILMPVSYTHLTLPTNREV